eukprot:1012296-Amphidinium_carterae.1
MLCSSIALAISSTQRIARSAITNGAMDRSPFHRAYIDLCRPYMMPCFIFVSGILGSNLRLAASCTYIGSVKFTAFSVCDERVGLQGRWAAQLCFLEYVQVRQALRFVQHTLLHVAELASPCGHVWSHRAGVHVQTASSPDKDAYRDE